MSEAARLGRPPVEDRRERERRLRFTADEDREIEEAAKRAGVPFARWVRERALDAARSAR
ncbi:plasmid mobilization protein [Rathayibacter sp. VKM Ac-2803]|uniref:plasmid mobilization protein n=1 Tax=Rathayibacter sp. VKM Ac-2803 TaxID=2609256 RepID=UPI003FA6FB71